MPKSATCSSAYLASKAKKAKAVARVRYLSLHPNPNATKATNLVHPTTGAPCTASCQWCTNTANKMKASARLAKADALRSAIALLTGHLPAAIDGFEAALKLRRFETGSRSTFFLGLLGYLHVLALLRSDDGKLNKKAQTLTDLGLRETSSPAWSALSYLIGVQTGKQQLGD